VILAIDTSTATCGVALTEPRGGFVARRRWVSDAGHARELMPAIDSLCRECGVSPRQIHEIAVAVGPGTFNGIRVAVTTARALAFALDVPVHGVNTLQLIACQFAGAESEVCACLGAARGEVALSRWRVSPSIVRLSPDEIVHPEAAFVRPTRPTIFAGELRESWIRMIGELGPLARLPPDGDPGRDPAILARMVNVGMIAPRGAATSSPDPIYLRPPHITRSDR